jgi:branched-chain amino acid transport system ATP-binding protein
MVKSPLLEVKNLVTGYGRIEAIHEISFSVPVAEIVCIIGSNGAGKSTLLNTLAGIHTPWSGTIVYANNDITSIPPPDRVKQGLSLVPEGRRVFPRLTVLENLELGAYVHKQRGKVGKEKFKTNFEKVVSLFPIIGERRKQLAGTLSGGEQQMLAIGRSLMSQPKLLLLDEPSMGVAPLLVDKIFDTLAKLNKEEDVTILLVEQNAERALHLSQQAFILELGKIVLEGKASELRNDERVKRAYLSE